jgi:replicative DNA helicase
MATTTHAARPYGRAAGDRRENDVSEPQRLRVVHGDGIDEETPPHSIPAEQSVLGSAMLWPIALAEVRTILDGSEFWRPAHQTIWDAICSLADAGNPHDPISVARALGPDIDKTGGAPYLHTLVSTAIVAATASHHAQIVADLAYARNVIAASCRLTQAARGNDTGTLRAAVAAETAALTESARRGWPDPVPLSAAMDLPEFPLWTLPAWLGEYCASLAEATQTPPDMAACLALAVLSVAASGKVRIEPRPGWTEPACLYVLVALPPGNRKSEVFRHLTAPLRQAETALIESARPAIAEAHIRLKLAEAAAENTAKAAQAAAMSVDNDRKAVTLIEAVQAREELDNARIPAEPCLFADDATIERLGSRLAEQGGRFAVLSPEGEIFSVAAGRYSGTPNIGILKSAHAGEAIRIDRQNRPAEHIESATLTLGICTQPSVLAQLGDTPEFRDQGLLARILYSIPESKLGWRNPDPDPLPASVREQFSATVTALTLSLHDLTEPQDITFAPDAAAAVAGLLGNIEPRFRPGADLAHMTDWGGKLTGAIARIAGLLHLAEHARDGWAQPVSVGTLEAAAEIGAYFTAHAKAAYDSIGTDPAVASARAILTWISHTNPGQFTARDLMRGLRGRFAKATDTTAPLAVLESHGWIRQRPAPPPSGGRGRPAASTWDTHPDLLKQA